MSIIERLTNCNDRFIGRNWSNSSLLSLIMIKWRRCNYNAFTNSPIDGFNNLELSCSYSYGSFKLSPSRISYLAMKTEFTISATKNFISENRKLFVIIPSMKCNGKFMLISVSLCTCNKLTSTNNKVMSI